MNHEYARGTIYKGCLAQGVLTANYILTVIGALMSGPVALNVSQNLKFKAPVRASDTVKAVCTVTELDENQEFAEIKI